ncbi:PPOX class F420-dependent oxidoreductase [uncultured Phycicoccus sp.]|uniref:PPOX class F420-dependent oxidoreductase n=1 Tax=uncultured Phycicoccus sp. TaxID=661422 RepID=UPI0026118BDE|nr:PPOX class F420-dependent oxidoreductase [uncultured Phycicoccus sp.]
MDPRRHPLAEAPYVSLTTFRRTGAPVSTPVWIAPAVDGTEHLVFVSVDDTGKTKRLAHTRRVELRPCDVRGQVADGAPMYRGEAEVVRDDAGVRAVRAALAAKYGWQARLLSAANAAAGLTGVGRKPRAAIVIEVEHLPAA